MRTEFPVPFEPVGCDECRKAGPLGFEFTMAFQPILDLDTGRPFPYEALVCGLNGEGAVRFSPSVTSRATSSRGRPSENWRCSESRRRWDGMAA